MNCDKVANLISDYLDGHLAVQARSEFESHVGGCDNCASELRQTRSMLQELAALGGCKSPVDCWGHVRRHTIRSRPQVLWRRYLLRPAAAVPALAAVLLLAALLIWPGSTPEPVRAHSAVSVSEYTLYVSEHSRLQSEGAFTDPAITFITAELETAELSPLPTTP